MRPTAADAARALETGSLVVYPTDTLLGLGARATDRDAVRRLEAVKGRPSDQPISVAVSSLEELEPLGEFSPAARRFVRTHLPGPYTVLVRPSAVARRSFPPPIVFPHHPVGLRVPDHPIARELARRVGPITATSANLHGNPPARTAAEARRAFGRRVAVYLAPGSPIAGVPSAVVDLTGGAPRPVPRRRFR